MTYIVTVTQILTRADMNRKCIDCEKDFEVPETMDDMNQCYDCWSSDEDYAFGKIEPVKINWYWVTVGAILLILPIIGLIIRFWF